MQVMNNNFVSQADWKVTSLKQMHHNISDNLINELESMLNEEKQRSQELATLLETREN